MKRLNYEAVRAKFYNAMLTSGRNHDCENRQALSPAWLSNLLSVLLIIFNFGGKN